MFSAEQTKKINDHLEAMGPPEGVRAIDWARLIKLVITIIQAIAPLLPIVPEPTPGASK